MIYRKPYFEVLFIFYDSYPSHKDPASIPTSRAVNAVKHCLIPNGFPL